MDLNQEQELVKSAKRDPQAFGALFDEYYPKILNYAARRTGQAELAQDIASETFLKAYRKLWQFKFRNVKFSAWLYRIANNEINDYFRRGKTFMSLEDLVSGGLQIRDRIDLLSELQEAEQQLKDQTNFLIIRKKISQLPMKYQEVIALRFFEQKQVNEVVEILGKKEGTVKSLLSRGISKLKESMEAEDAAVQPLKETGVVISEGQENN